MFSGSGFSHDKHIQLALEKNASRIHSMHASLSRAPSPHRSGLPIGIPHQHRQKEEDPHLHTQEIYKGKA
jgi:hypothetical protein